MSRIGHNIGMKSRLETEVIPVLKDNYTYLIHCSETGCTAVVDPSEADPVLSVLEKKRWKLSWILNTHHHWDHIGGNPVLVEKTGTKVAASLKDQERVPFASHILREGEVFKLGKIEISPLEIPGHTLGHLAFWIPQEKMVFTGDTLFLFGCGRLFEGTALQMWTSLQKVKNLPDDTLVYCGHEYTEKNLKFVEESFSSLEGLESYRKKLTVPSVPGVLGEQKKQNPFLFLNLEEFTALRKKRDDF
jgi:hydroxyacylglutathione hydrolase